MIKYKYIKWHDNYDGLELSQVYEGYKYKEGWIWIDNVLYREDCFTVENKGNFKIKEDMRYLIGAIHEDGQIEIINENVLDYDEVLLCLDEETINKYNDLRVFESEEECFCLYEEDFKEQILEIVENEVRNDLSEALKHDYDLVIDLFKDKQINACVEKLRNLITEKLKTNIYAPINDGFPLEEFQAKAKKFLREKNRTKNISS